MTAYDPEPDPELARLLQEWAVPALPDTLDERVRALFRSRAPRRPRWRRFLATSIRVPLPVAAVLVLLLLVASWRATRPAPALEADGSREPARAARSAPRPAQASGLAGFEPVREMNVAVLPGSASR